LRKSGRLLEELRNDDRVIGIDAPLPSLVTLGRDSRGILMINLEIAGSVAVSGPEADRLIQAIAVELATAQWSDQIDLVLVGFGDVDQSLERVSHAKSLAPVGAKMKRRVEERAALLATMDRATNSESRWREGGDSWDLCVVVCSPNVSENELDVLDQLIATAGDGSFGVAVICGREALSARWHAGTDRGSLVSVDGVGLSRSSLSLQSVPPDLVEKVGDLVTVASVTTGVTPDEAPYGKLSLRIPERDAHQWPTTGSLAGGEDSQDSAGERPSPSGQPEVEVRVLGPVAIIGAARSFTRAWAIELVVYLAVHPGGVSNEQWATALWPEKAMAPASLHSTASAARRSLGTSASGEDHLPHSRGRLALGPAVSTDWDRFVDLSQSPVPDDWREALELIDGRPFDGLRSPDWVVLEGIQATVEAGIVDLTCRYAQHCLEAFDASGAEWAARQGLRVSAYDERLYRVLLQAADAAGNPAGVESVMAELVHLVADDVEPFDAVHPETMALYRRLSRRGFPTRSR
jgi:DNA-binding SARP family transcriptional activator